MILKKFECKKKEILNKIKIIAKISRFYNLRVLYLPLYSSYFIKKMFQKIVKWKRKIREIKRNGNNENDPNANINKKTNSLNSNIIILNEVYFKFIF